MKIRLWKLGSKKHRVMPTTEGIEKLARIIAEADYDKDLDIVWGPYLKVYQFDSDTKDIEIVCGPNVM